MLSKITIRMISPIAMAAADLIKMGCNSKATGMGMKPYAVTNHNPITRAVSRGSAVVAKGELIAVLIPGNFMDNK